MSFVVYPEVRHDAVGAYQGLWKKLFNVKHFVFMYENPPPPPRQFYRSGHKIPAS